MKDVVIAGYLRTPQSRSKPEDPPKDWFHALRADELLADLIPEVLHRAGIQSEDVDDFLVGASVGQGEQWTFRGRFPLFLANLPSSVPAKFVDQQCGSSMACIHIGFLEIGAGFAETVIVCGMENMTRVGLNVAEGSPLSAAPSRRLVENATYKHWDIYTAMKMGLTAEKLLSITEFTREDLDTWALRSHRLASEATESGFFQDEILPVTVFGADDQVRLITLDQSVRADTSLESLSRLVPAFGTSGQCTAGNSSPRSAGASCMLLMSKERAKQRGFSVLATIRSIGFAGVDPTLRV